ARGRPCSRDPAEAAAAGRADGRHEPAGDRGVHGVRREAANGGRADRSDDRARHEGSDGHLGPRHRSRLRREDRGGRAGGGPPRPACDRGVPRSAGEHGVTSTMPRTNGREKILELDDVHTYYGSIHALKGISIVVFDGEIVTLIGANGAGKSTT